MSKKMSRVFLLVAMVFVFFPYSIFAADPVIKLGTIFSRTGPIANLGIESWRGSEMARIIQNEKGGILGKKIVFVDADAPDAKAAVAETERLCTVEKVPAILGSFSSSICFAASAKAEQYKVVYWELGASAKKITERGLKYLFRTCQHGDGGGEQQLQFVAEVLAPRLGKNKNTIRIASVYEDSGYGGAWAAGINEMAKKMGVKLVLDEVYNHKATDLSSLVMRIKAANPDVIIESSYENDAILLFRQTREMGLKIKMFVGSGGGMNLPGYRQGAGDGVDNHVCNVGFPGYNLNPKFAKGIEKLIDLYKKTFKQEPEGVFSLVNYMGTMALWDVIQRAGSLDSEALVKAARETNISGNDTILRYGIKFAPPGSPNMGQNILSHFFVTQWQDAKLHIVWPDDAATPGRKLVVAK
jgi:branched-chain amino acid transport system substrate-binding protein